MKLTAQNVKDTFMACLFIDEQEAQSNQQIIVEGIKNKIGFHAGRVELNKDKISEMLHQLHPNFMRSGGGGYTFLNMCEDANGNQWCDMHQTMEQLMTLGMAIGECSYLMPREMWGMFPGGMPYIVIN